MPTINIKWIIGILVLVGTFIAGARWGSVNTVVTQEVKGETKTVYKDRIVTITKVVQPDGTVTETTKIENKEGSTKSKSSEKVAQVVRPKYSLGLMASPHVERDGMHVKKVSLLPGVTAGYALANDIWLKVGAVPADNIYVVGIEFQF